MSKEKGLKGFFSLKYRINEKIIYFRVEGLGKGASLSTNTLRLNTLSLLQTGFTNNPKRLTPKASVNSNYTVSGGEKAEITGQPTGQPARTDPQSIRDFPHPGRLKVLLSPSVLE